MLIESPAFAHEQKIPFRYTCEGEDISPPLKFLEVPRGTRSLVLIVDDPDAPSGVFDHWIIWNIPPKTLELSAGGEVKGAKQGVNGFRQIGYNGPCPPPGKPHRYYFKLYALDNILNVEAGATKDEIEKAMDPYILEKAELIGTYKRG